MENIIYHSTLFWPGINTLIVKTEKYSLQVVCLFLLAYGIFVFYSIFNLEFSPLSQGMTTAISLPYPIDALAGRDAMQPSLIPGSPTVCIEVSLSLSKTPNP